MANMEKPIAPPVIPERTHRMHQSRRRSLPSSSAGRAEKSTRNSVRIQPASPEVISSLISSLSAISSPANQHFETLPPSIGQSKSTPSSPNPLYSSFDEADAQPDNATSGGFGVDYGAFKNPESRDWLHPDDAATPPIVRTSKPPSGLGLAGAQRSASTPSSPVKSLFSRSGSKDFDETGSIGSVSVEHIVPAPLEIKGRRSSVDSEGKRSRKSYRGLMHMSSKERLRSGFGSPQSPSFPSPITSPILDHKPSLADEMIKEEPAVEAAPPKVEALDASTTPESSQSPRVGGDASPGSMKIPHRESSLRHSDDKARSKKRRSRLSPDQEGEEGPKQSIKERRAERRAESSSPIIHESSGDVPASLKRDSRRHGLAIVPAPPLGDVPSLSHSHTTSSIPTTSTEKSRFLQTPDSAPSPAIGQRKLRESSHRLGSLPTIPSDSSTSTPSGDPPSAGRLQSPRDPPSIPQSNTRTKRYSGPSSPGIGGSHQVPRSQSHRRHQRSLSNPLQRRAEQTESIVSSDDRPSTADSIDDAVESYLAAPRLSQKIRHPQTGRLISFSEVGDPDGLAVFCCVGMGLTRYITAFYDELAATLKLRLITPDRPGVGDSEPYTDGTSSPLSWPDDIYAICQSLGITKFSLLAHSAGAIYALAAALRMPQHIRGRIHLLAPWIPPSQMTAIGSNQTSAPAASVPTSQRILRALPTTFLKAANSSFMSTTSASITSSLPKSPRRKRRSASGRSAMTPGPKDTHPRPSRDDTIRDSMRPSAGEQGFDPTVMTEIDENERRTEYDTRLTQAIWRQATTGANPAVDLLVCLERRHAIGFRYVDITRAVVIHHGSRDTRVPVENVRWLGKTMRRCEVRVLEGEGHGLMASPTVMGNVLMELGKEWDDWMKVVKQSRSSSRNTSPQVGRGSEWRR